MPLPEIEYIGRSWGDLTQYAGRSIFEQTLSDASGAPVPSGLTYDLTTAPAGTFSPTSVCAALNSEPRSNLPCATKIGREHVIQGHVVATGPITWLDENESEVTRTVIETHDIDFGWRLCRLDSPLDEIPSLPLLADSSVLIGRTLLSIEADYHLSLRPNADAAANLIIWGNGDDPLEDGDSSKPILVRIGGRWVLISVCLTGIQGPDLCRYAADIADIMAANGDELSLVQPTDYIGPINTFVMPTSPRVQAMRTSKQVHAMDVARRVQMAQRSSV